MSEACKQIPTTVTTKKKFTVLQKRKHRHLDGYSCQVIRSEFEMYCGSFSHMKLIQPPNIEIPVPVSQHECTTAAKSGRYTTHFGTTHDTRVGTETVFTVTERGVVTEGKNNIFCEGEKIKINDHLIDGVIIMAQYRIKILEEKFIVERGRVEVISSHQRLPADCPPEGQACTAGGLTYLWEYSVPCPFVKIRQLILENENEFLVDHTNKLIFRELDKARFPPTCQNNGAIYYYTEYSSLYLTEESEFDPVTEIDITLYVASRDEYLNYQWEKKSNQISISIKQQMCTATYQTDNRDIIPINGDHFGRRSGDIMYIFQCPLKTAEIAIVNKCYRRTPIKDGNGGIMFVEPTTKIATKHDTPIPCPPLAFAKAIETKEGKWINLNPDLKLRTAPTDNSLVTYNPQVHEDMRTGSLFTTEQLNEWESTISWSMFRDTVTENLAQGVCRGSQTCTYGSTSGGQYDRYDLSLLTPLEDKLPSTPFSLFRRFVEENLVWVAISIITKWFLDLAITITMVSLTLARDGFEQAVQFVYMTLLPTVYKHQKSRRRQLRREMEYEAEREAALAVPLNPIYPKLGAATAPKDEQSKV